MVNLILVAGGNGSRFNQDQTQLPKQYIKIDGEFLIKITANHFLKHKAIKKIVIAIRKEDEGLAKQIFETEITQGKIFLVYGGKSRLESVKNGVFLIKNHDLATNFVLIHDAARPMIPTDLIQNLINKIEVSDSSGVFPGLEITDALKLKRDNKIYSVNRSEYLISQTPQIFCFKSLTHCFENFDFDNALNLSEIHDEIDLIERFGFKSDFINGSKQNIKITTQNDLEIYKNQLSSNEI